MEKWGLAPGIGTGKTEAIAFVYGAKQPTVLPPLHAPTPDKLVHWVEKYKYLGSVIRWDLGQIDNAERIAKAVRGTCQQYFHCSPIVRGMPLSTQLQLMQGHVLAGATYLMSTALLEDSQWNHAEVPVRDMLKDILFLNGNLFPNALMYLLSGMVPLRILALSHRARLLAAAHTVAQRRSGVPV